MNHVITTVVLLCSASAVLSALLWRGMSEVFAAPVLRRQNYAGRDVAIGSGLVMILSFAVVTAAAELWANIAIDEPFDGQYWDVFETIVSLPRVLTLVLGFGLLGLLDDLVGDSDRRGFRGHVGAALSGKVTTGFVKLAGGVVIAYLVSPGLDTTASIRAALLIAATANLGNLFDRAPGRTIKVSLVGLGVIALCGVTLSSVAGVVVVVSAAIGVLMPDLRERCMLGDTGSNVLGSVVGFGLVAALDDVGQWAALAVVVALNLLSEKVSFSKVIDATPPLRWFDRLGSLRD